VSQGNICLWTGLGLLSGDEDTCLPSGGTMALDPDVRDI
jgi:hypothetical protein